LGRSGKSPGRPVPAEIRNFWREASTTCNLRYCREGYAVDTPGFSGSSKSSGGDSGENVYPQVGVIGLSTATVREKIAFAYKPDFALFRSRCQIGAR